MDLIKLSDGHNTVRLHILGRHRPGVLPEHDLMDAEIVVSSDFISGQFRVHFFLTAMESWSQALHSINKNHEAEWLDIGNGPTIKIRVAENEDSDVMATIEDTSGSGVTVVIPMALDDDWIEDHHERINRARKNWPIEVLEKTPRSYEWKK